MESLLGLSIRRLSNFINKNSRNNLKERWKERLICPISGQIFYDPHIARDGRTYEQDELLRWFEIKKVSPLTGDPLDTDTIPNLDMKANVDIFLTEYPEEKTNVYQPETSYGVLYEKINNFIIEGEFDELIKYKEYDLLRLISTDHIASDLEQPICLFAILLQDCKDENIIMHILDNSLDLNVFRESDKKTPLHFACSMSTVNIVKRMIKLGANPEAATVNNWTPIFDAIYFNNLDVVNYLLEIGVDLSIKDNLGFTPVFLALDRLSQSSADKIAEDIIIKMLKSDVDLEVATNDQKRLIHFACMFSNKAVISYLLAKNVNVAVFDRYKTSPLHIASSNVSITSDIYARLVVPTIINARDDYGRTALHYACINNHIEKSSYLIKQKAALDIFDSNGMTPLHLACMPVMKFDQFATTSSSQQLIVSNLEIVKLLINSGADPELYDPKNNIRVINVAAQHSERKVIEYLLDRNINLLTSADTQGTEVTEAHDFIKFNYNLDNLSKCELIRTMISIKEYQKFWKN